MTARPFSHSRYRCRLTAYQPSHKDQQAGTDEAGDQIGEPADAEGLHAEGSEDCVQHHRADDAIMMFMKMPVLLFITISASQPARPPMMMAAIQPTPFTSIC